MLKIWCLVLDGRTYNFYVYNVTYFYRKYTGMFFVDFWCFIINFLYQVMSPEDAGGQELGSDAGYFSTSPHFGKPSSTQQTTPQTPNTPNSIPNIILTGRNQFGVSLV